MPTFQSVSQPLPFNLKYNDDHTQQQQQQPNRITTKTQRFHTSMTSMISASFYLTVRLRDAFVVYNGNIRRNYSILLLLHLYIAQNTSEFVGFILFALVPI